MNITPENNTKSEAQDLIWALLDEQISGSDFQRLEAMIRDDDEIRRLYVQCVQIHVDLQQWFGGSQGAAPGQFAGLPFDLPLTSQDSALVDPAF